MHEALGVAIELIGDIFTVAGYTGQRLATLAPHPALPPPPRASVSRGPRRSDTYEATTTTTTMEEDGEMMTPIQKHPSMMDLGTAVKCCANPGWVAGFLVFALGQFLELVALGFASESTVVAVGNLCLVFNAVASVYVFGEDFNVVPPAWKGRGRSNVEGVVVGKPWWYVFHRWDGFNLFLLIAGSATTVAFAPLSTEDEESKFTAEELRRMWTQAPFVYFNATCVVLMIYLGYKCRQNFVNKDEPKAPMFLASALSILAAFSVTLSKVVTELTGKTASGNNQFDDLGAWGMTVLWLFGLVLQLILLNVGLRNFEQGVFVPMFETMSSSITIVFGVFYFKTYRDFHGEIGKVIGFCIGVLVLIIGLFLSSKRHSPSREEMVARLHDVSPRSSSLVNRSFSLSDGSAPSAPLLPVRRPSVDVDG